MRRLPLLTTWLLLLSPAAATQPGPKPGEAAPPKPSVSVSFERQSIREDASVQVQVWLSNESGENYTEARLYVSVPSFIEWRESPCDVWREEDPNARAAPLNLGPIPAHSVKPVTLCLRSGSDIVVGDFNTLFTLEYAWEKEGAPRRSFLTIEKQLKVSLLGSDSVAGIPVGLAGFIVPGLFFWIIVGLFAVPWLPWQAGQLALGDRLIYSVLVSIGIVVAGGRFELTDISAGIGLSKLGYLALSGIALGTLAGVGDRLWRLHRRRQAERKQRLLEQQALEAKERQVKVGEGPDVLLEKLFRLPGPVHLPETTVRLKDGREYVGSLGRKDEEATALLGWFQIDAAGRPAEVVRELRAAVAAGRWQEALAIVRGGGMGVAVYDPIYEQNDGERSQLAEEYLTWPSAEVEFCRVEAGKSVYEPLTLP